MTNSHLSPTAIAKPSGKGGFGLFAMQDFAAGTRVRSINVVREVTAQRPLVPDEDADHCMRILDRAFLIGEPDCYVNHCCDPNAFKRFRNEVIDIVAMRDISAGDEITYDYMINTATGNAWRCDCGSKKCRGSTSVSFFDLPINLQLQYRPYLAPWFVDAFRDRIDAIHS
jgi:uncharacterized protein